MSEAPPNGVGAEMPVSVELPARPPFSRSWLGRTVFHITSTDMGRYRGGFLALLLAALLLRLWELGGRTMHYDEAIHLYYSWRLSNFEGFVHSPWMHGPFQIEVVAFLLKLLGDTDVTARLAYVLIGTALVGLPYFLKDHLGRSGALLTGVMLAVSPSLLYFSRFGRNDIIMAFLAVSLFALLWHYVNNPKNRYLYLTAAALAVAFAAKESAYIITVIFGALALLMALPYSRFRRLWSWRHQSREEPGEEQQPERPAVEAIVRQEPTAGPRPSLVRRGLGVLDPGRLNPAAGFLVLLITLTLPLWSAGADLARTIAASLAGLVRWHGAAEFLDKGFGLTLIGRDDVSQGIVGAPLWAGPFVQLPITQWGVWMPGLLALLVVVVCIVAGWALSKGYWRKAAAIVLPLGVAYAAAFALFGPLGSGINLLISLALGMVGVAAFAYLRFPWKYSFLLLFIPSFTAVVFSILFLPVLKVDALLTDVLPEGVQVASSGNAVPLNFLAAAGILLTFLVVSMAAGLLWKGGVWLACAVIFWLVWATLYTTFFTNPAGVFSGAWQGLGYWIAQQDVARGNQPWYYYLVGLSVYEFLPVIFGVVGAVVFVRRRNRFGMALAFWAGLNFLAYTVASEKMPWLLVNITVPFIFLAGKLLGELVDRVSWRRVLRRQGLPASLSLVAIPGVALAGIGYSALALTGEDGTPWKGIGVLAVSVLLLLAAAWLLRRRGAQNGPALAGLGVAGLLLGFTSWTAFQAAYTYDDSRQEILVYAQGSANLLDTYLEMDRHYFEPNGAFPLPSPVQVDYDVWYPFQWYVRHDEKEGRLDFSCFRDEDGQDGCRAIKEDPGASAILLAAHHRQTPPGALARYRQSGPQRNLLWFPETYRRPGENRQSEEFMEEVKQDLLYFKEAATSRDKWRQALGFLSTRDMETDWFNSEYYTYRRRVETQSENEN